MSHPTFDVDLWRTRLLTNFGEKIDESQIYERLRWPMDSPIAILVWEYFRNKALASGLKLGRKIPVDQFTFGRGEPPERHLTKLHGLPYRPRTLPWPTDKDGIPLTFLAQYSFVDSRDHMKELPGDVLLIFIRNPESWLVFEWHRLGIEDLVMETPAPRMRFPICYGVRHRTWDFPNESVSMPAFQSLIDTKKISTNAHSLEQSIRAMAVFSRMKIGGSPYWFDPSDISRKYRSRRRFLCGFNGLTVVSDSPYPFVNQPQPTERGRGLFREDQILFYDGLVLNFFLNDDGSIDYHGQFP
jgi:hypothetical protein